MFESQDLEIHGDALGQQKYQDWKNREVLNKRDKKAAFKTQQMKMSKEELQSSRQSMPNVIDNEYIKACTRNLIPVKDYVNNIYEVWGEEWYIAAVKRMEILETFAKNINILKTPTPRKENTCVTLREYCE